MASDYGEIRVSSCAGYKFLHILISPFRSPYGLSHGLGNKLGLPYGIPHGMTSVSSSLIA